MNRFGKQSAWTVAVLSMLLMGTACSNDNDNSPSASGSASASASASPSASASSSSSSEPSESATPSSSVSDKMEGTGTYNGLGDSNSIEIQFNGQPTAFRIDPETEDKLSNWDEGVKVKFQYVETTTKVGDEQVKQLSIVSIDKQ